MYVEYDRSFTKSLLQNLNMFMYMLKLFLYVIIKTLTHMLTLSSCQRNKYVSKLKRIKKINSLKPKTYILSFWYWSMVISIHPNSKL